MLLPVHTTIVVDCDMTERTLWYSCTYNYLCLTYMLLPVHYTEDDWCKPLRWWRLPLRPECLMLRPQEEIQALLVYQQALLKYRTLLECLLWECSELVQCAPVQPYCTLFVISTINQCSMNHLLRLCYCSTTYYTTSYQAVSVNFSSTIHLL